MESIKSVKEKTSKARMLWFVIMLWTTTKTLSLLENWNSIRIVNNKDNSLNLMHRKTLAQENWTRRKKQYSKVTDPIDMNFVVLC